MVPTLRDGVITSKQSKGVAWMSAEQSPHRQAEAIFVTKTHFDIFGLFFPVASADLPSAVAIVTDLYLQMNVSLNVHPTINVAAKLQGAAARWPQVWQQQLDTITRFQYFEYSK